MARAWMLITNSRPSGADLRRNAIMYNKGDEITLLDLKEVTPPACANHNILSASVSCRRFRSPRLRSIAGPILACMSPSRPCTLAMP